MIGVVKTVRIFIFSYFIKIAALEIVLGATFSVLMMSKHTPEHVNWKTGSCRFRPMVSSPPPSSPPQRLNLIEFAPNQID